MKKLLIGITALCILASGCGKKEEAQTGFTVMTSFYPVYIVAKNITKDVPGVYTLNMTPPVTGCLHDYSMTTEDMKHLEKGNLFLINGAGKET